TNKVRYNHHCGGGETGQTLRECHDLGIEPLKIVDSSCRGVHYNICSSAYDCAELENKGICWTECTLDPQ
ncbi:hypothetical protein LCGC14_1994880, partial [marine sediment metagenome]